MTPSGHLHLSQTTLRLSEPLTATVMIEGNAPVSVTPPSPLLIGSSAQSWQIVPAGPPKVTVLLDSVERWTQTYRLEPFVAGPAVPVEFAPFVVNGMPVELPSESVQIHTTLGDGVPTLRDFAGPEPLPDAIHPDASLQGPLLAAGLGVLILAAAVWHRLRQPQVKPVLLPTLDERLLAVERMTEPRQFVEELAALLREGSESRTTAEIAVADPARAAILTRCDAVIFAAEPLTAEQRSAMLAETRALLVSGQLGPVP